MPWSRYEQIETIIDLMVRLAPRAVLDVGIGNGLYGLLVRQYVEGAGPFSRDGVQLDGVEIFEAYLTDVQRSIYNEIFVGDALHILPEMPSRGYDLALGLDVLEHLPDPQGDELLHHLRRVARHVMITSPRSKFPQGPMFGNIHESHVSEWPPIRLRRAGAALIVPNPFVSIALFTDDRAFARYYRRYVLFKRIAAVVPVSLVAQARKLSPLRRFVLRRIDSEQRQTSK